MKNARAKRRFTDHKPVGRPLTLDKDHAAVKERRTLFPSRVATTEFPARTNHTSEATKVTLTPTIFKSGVNSRKIGSHVTKGAWKGMPIYTLTLEERATCPTYCEHFQDCFGNKMHWSTRFAVNAEFKLEMTRQAIMLAQKHPAGFVVRLHVLGDFPNVPYVRTWAWLMAKHEACHVFGYTRWKKESPIGRALQTVADAFPDRWKIRWSERGGEMGTKTTKDITLKGNTPDGIVCPAQTNQTSCCGTCALCWSTPKPIVFIQH